LEYRFYTEFQSHEPEFDYLKSVELEVLLGEGRGGEKGKRRKEGLRKREKFSNLILSLRKQSI
jgi:hypothetical protein